MILDTLAKTKLTRRRLHHLTLGVPAPLALTLLGGRMAGVTLAQPTESTATAGATPAADATPAGVATPVLAPTPECGDDDDFETTLEQTEGPYFTRNSPERTSLLEPGVEGTKLVVTGYVYSTECQPIERALIDFWQADNDGEYDNVGYKLRGHQFTNKDGRYELTTILPGLYPGRTRHIHVKVQAPNQPVLTTQLYFPDEPSNASDRIFDPALVIDWEERDEVTEQKEGALGFFTFVLDVA